MSIRAGNTLTLANRIVGSFITVVFVGYLDIQREQTRQVEHGNTAVPPLMQVTGVLRHIVLVEPAGFNTASAHIAAAGTHRLQAAVQAVFRFHEIALCRLLKTLVFLVLMQSIHDLRPDRHRRVG